VASRNKEESSFSEEKEAKRLLFNGSSRRAEVAPRPGAHARRAAQKKPFCVFFFRMVHKPIVMHKKRPGPGLERYPTLRLNKQHGSIALVNCTRRHIDPEPETPLPPPAQAPAAQRLKKSFCFFFFRKRRILPSLSFPFLSFPFLSFLPKPD
jgi:hypothetical protein